MAERFSRHGGGTTNTEHCGVRGRAATGHRSSRAQGRARRGRARTGDPNHWREEKAPNKNTHNPSACAESRDGKGSPLFRLNMWHMRWGNTDEAMKMVRRFAKKSKFPRSRRWPGTTGGFLGLGVALELSETTADSFVQVCPAPCAVRG